MSDEKFIRLNVAFRIPDDIAKVVIDLSREIAEKEETYFVLDGVEYFPHISNYSVEFPEKNLDKVIRAVEDLSKEFSPVEFIFEKNKANGGWIAPYFTYTQQLKDIQAKFVEKLNFLRENRIKEKILTDERFSSKDEKENIERYGHPWVLELYDPHLTITKLKDAMTAEKIANEMKWTIASFTSDAIGIFVSGEHGTCRKLLKEFKLGK